MCMHRASDKRTLGQFPKRNSTSANTFSIRRRRRRRSRGSSQNSRIHIHILHDVEAAQRNRGVTQEREKESRLNGNAREFAVS
ncbi:hypothetical protein TSAR_014063 [Trichomalopsis sarcophagae]|uniref:Uncharacterized protein n=1 Tax=Trichomalopsis sarcophagae TaxID=543379 RepID=A0A232FMR8_9HYME|nr:hypothetical protein TSAR_014063 [Trichomalopsis sarcophagae]